MYCWNVRRSFHVATGWWPLTHGDAATNIGGFGGTVPGRSHGCLQRLPGPHALVARPGGGLVPFCDQVPQPNVVVEVRAAGARER